MCTHSLTQSLTHSLTHYSWGAILFATLILIGQVCVVAIIRCCEMNSCYQGVDNYVHLSSDSLTHTRQIVVSIGATADLYTLVLVGRFIFGLVLNALL